MRAISIKEVGSGQILYHGRFRDLKACVEAAIADGASLKNADLRHANLAHAALDDGELQGARLDNANLCGANISEAALEGAILTNAALQNACFSFADLRQCDFTGGLFGATDITGARMDGARFSTLSSFTLNFRDTASMDDCLFFNETSRESCRFSRPPIAITGLAWPVALLDSHVQVGSNSIALGRLPFKRGYKQADITRLQAFLNVLRNPLEGERILRTGSKTKFDVT
jgi:hypothetical protein